MPFSRNSRSAIIDKTIRKGLVLKLFFDDIVEPHDKYFIILGIGNLNGDGSVLYAFINSEINFYINFNQELVNHNILIRARHHSFLHHNSYVDCSKTRIWDLSELQEIIDNRPECVVGELNNEQLEPYTSTIRDSKLFRGKIKNRYNFYN